jgi:hypothetical protein
MQFPWLPEVVKGQVTPSEFPLRMRIWKLRNIRHSGDFFTGSEVPVTPFGAFLRVRMRNRKLRNICPSGAFFTGSTLWGVL